MSEFELTQQPSRATCVAAELVRVLQDLGARHAFGVSGGGVGPLWDELAASDMRLLHFRHESGAGFAALEASLASGRLVVVVTTTGPGLTNALTGMCAARRDGAKVVLISGKTMKEHRGRAAFQETNDHALPAALFTASPLFDYAVALDRVDQLPHVVEELARGVERPGGFTAHLCMTLELQLTPAIGLSLPPLASADDRAGRPTARPEEIARCAEILASEPFVIWVGAGARLAAASVRELAERTGAPVICSPRAKGIFPETHPQFAGVTGMFGGQDTPVACMLEHRPTRALVLGSRLGESTSLWYEELAPSRGFIHVDIDSSAFGAAYPGVETLPVCSDVDAFLRALLEQMPAAREATLPPRHWPRPPSVISGPAKSDRVHPFALMDALQRRVVDRDAALVLADPGSSFAWTNYLLRFEEPGRYRVSPHFASMGTACAGVIGAALGGERRALAVVGDGALLMTNEISTAVHYGVPAAWVVLNNARYGMVDQGQKRLNYRAGDFDLPATNFALIAQAMGAGGLRVTRAEELDGALDEALSSPRPFVIDVLVDPDIEVPFGKKTRSAIAASALAGRAKESHHEP